MLVLSTPSSVLRDREIQEVRDPPTNMGTPPFTPTFPAPRSHGRSSGDIPHPWGQPRQQRLLWDARGRMLGETSQKGSQDEDAWGKHPGRLLGGLGA